MPRKVDQSKRIEEFKIQFSNKYSYEKFAYINAHTKSIVTCPLHGDFEITPNSHKNGKGCPRCGAKSRARKEWLTHEEVMARFEKLDNTDVDFSFVRYIPENTTEQKLKFRCGIHDKIFEKDIYDYIRGRRCPDCARESAARKQAMQGNEWARRCIERYDGFYTYKNLDKYVNQKSVMEVICPLHGDFAVVAASHLHKSGCGDCGCSGYKKSKSGFVYILYSKNLVKIGITNNLPNKRLAQINTSAYEKFAIYTSFYFDDGNMPFNIEQHLLQILRKNYQQPKEKFDGSTECFYDLDPKYLKFLIEQKIQELKSEETPLETA